MATPTNQASIQAARTLLLRGHLLLSPPTGGSTPAGVLKLIRDLGFVQLDSINLVQRAHHHILWTRLPSYRAGHLERLQESGRVFEHWTHDASIIPSELFPHWRHRFAKVEATGGSAWVRSRLGEHKEAVLKNVIARVRDHGPVMARDFEHTGTRSGPWWDWKPAKAALEYWWRAGKLAVPRRVNFQKVYDLADRVLPHVQGEPAPSREAHVDWACSGALQRLGIATPRELADFWKSVSVEEAAGWAKAAVQQGQAVSVVLAGDKPRPCVARPDWRRRVSSAGNGPEGMRILSPFDPVVRDRARCLRLFGFDYRFEAFTPAPKRKYGYYVLPILETGGSGPGLVGRLDPSLDRGKGTLDVRIWWEPGVKVSKARRVALADAIEQYARFNEAGRWSITQEVRRE